MLGQKASANGKRLQIKPFAPTYILINKQAIIEASGNVNLSTVKDIGSVGVDIISSSAIVAKAPTLDLALDI